jgi:hypothetical protein
VIKPGSAAADRLVVVHDASDGLYGSEVAAAVPTCASCGAARGPEPWCRRCLEPYDRPVDLASVFPPAREPIRPRHSRFKSGPMSFGLPGRLTLSFVPAVLAFIAIGNLVRTRHDAMFAFSLVSDVPILVLLLGFLVVVWRRARVS